jgi:hypothetical protein
MTKRYSNYLYAFLIVVTFLLYIIIRAYAWHNDVTLGEDSDSLGYLENIKIFSRFDFEQIMNLTPTVTPFYPFFGAIIMRLGLPLEIAARTCSLLFSGLLFLSVWGIGKKIGTKGCTMIGDFCFTCSVPCLQRIGESSYIAIIIRPMDLLSIQKSKIFERNDSRSLFRLAFLGRTEGFCILL